MQNGHEMVQRLRERRPLASLAAVNGREIERSFDRSGKRKSGRRGEGEIGGRLGLRKM